jgi:stress response protein SCP2
MNVQSIVLRRLNKILLPVSGKRVSAPTPYPALVATFNLNIQALGYTLSPDAIKGFLRLGEASAVLLFDEILTALKEAKGVKNYRPMYPNFPKQVIEASDAELYINAICHYFSFLVVDITGNPDNIWLPKYVKDKREPLDEKVELRVVDLATTEDIDTLTTRLATSNTSLSASDKEELSTLIKNGYGKLLDIFPAIPNKENLAYVGALLQGTAIDIAPYFKTATDVLRLATAMSNGDVSLKDDSKFRSFKRSERKFLLGLLEAAGSKEEDMLRFPARWVRLGERLHPGEFAKRFPTTLKAFTTLRNNETVETFRTHVEAAVRSGNALQATTLLTQRPGEFARRLDHVLRQAGTPAKQGRVVDAFLAVAHDVSTPVLLQVLAHFEHRDETDMRVVFPKGNVAKVMSLEKTLENMSKAVTRKIATGIKAVLVERFSILPELGNVYIDSALQDCLLPFSQRSASKTFRTLVRGSKLPFGDEKGTVRFFIWWKEGKSGKADSDLEENFYGYHSNRVDLDLSACAYDENWVSKGAVTYYNLREQFAVHSGDITSAPKGASEFIDVDIAKALKAGVRYIVQTVHSFTGQKFADVPECFAGFMLREKPQSGEVYDPRTVVDRADVTTEATSVVPMIIDLVDRKVIWVDATMTTGNNYRYSWRGGNNVASTRGTIELLGKAFTNIKKPNLYDLLNLHVEARGTLVDEAEEADVVFSVEAGTPFELDRIASEFMADAVKAPVVKKKAVAV